MGMIPIGDDNSDRTLTPLVNYLPIVANIAVFVLLQRMGGNDRFTYAFSLVPRRSSTGGIWCPRSNGRIPPAGRASRAGSGPRRSPFT